MKQVIRRPIGECPDALRFDSSLGSGFRCWEVEVQFSPGQRDLAINALGEAEDHISRYYCIPPHRWQHLRYDLLTRQDTEWEPLPDAALARVQQFAKSPSRGREPFDFYRIQLNDPSILSAAEREKLGDGFYHFLVYILTHEMVHLVRLSSIIGHDWESPVCADSEERRVQKVSHQILSYTGRHSFRPILERFCLPFAS